LAEVNFVHFLASLLVKHSVSCIILLILSVVKVFVILDLLNSEEDSTV